MTKGGPSQRLSARGVETIYRQQVRLAFVIAADSVCVCVNEKNSTGVRKNYIHQVYVK